MTQFDLPQEIDFEKPQDAIRQLWDRQLSFEKQMAYYLRNLEAAIRMLTGLDNEGKAWLWQNTNSGWKDVNNPW